ncbi:hypothetical protein GAO52_30895 [Bacteroides thetaiotaomicron]|nr:hypothetical protein GAO52_30895 [Bacteroides thetaiotaomicron]
MSDVRQLTPAACILVTLPYRSATVWSATKVVLNPLIVFNGDRVSFTKTYVRKKSLSTKKKAEEDERQLSLGFSSE